MANNARISAIYRKKLRRIAQEPWAEIQAEYRHIMALRAAMAD